MRRSVVILAVAAALCAGTAAAQPPRFTLKAAVVALTEDAELRARFEDGLVAKAREQNYDAVTSYDLVPDVSDVDNRRFLRTMNDERVGVALIMRPAAIGAGSSLDSVRDAIDPDVYQNMRQFAREVSPSEGGDLFAVVHLGIYLLYDRDAELLSSGAVWLEEQAENQDEAIELLQNLVLDNVNSVREPLRRHLRIPER